MPEFDVFVWAKRLETDRHLVLLIQIPSNLLNRTSKVVEKQQATTVLHKVKMVRKDSNNTVTVNSLPKELTVEEDTANLSMVNLSMVSNRCMVNNLKWVTVK